MKLHHIPIAVIIIAFVTIGLTTFISEMTENYEQESDLTTLTELNSGFDSIASDSEKLSNLTKEFIPEPDDAGQYLLLPYKFLRTGWQMIYIFFKSIFTLGGAATIIANALTEQGIPMSAEVITLLVVVMTLTITAIIAYGFKKWKFDDR